MTAPRHIAVIDIGKTNAKLALVDLATRTEIAVVTRPNKGLQGPPWAHFDTDGHWDFLLGALKTFHRAHHVDAISVTTHGASIALLDRDGVLAAPIIDYEHPIPDAIAAAYDALRPPFAHTGSPRLANGLNAGAQLHYMFAQDPRLLARTDKIVTYPQYWGHRLTGVAACDVTSIGCHTDLWHPTSGTFSDVVDRLGLAGKIAPVRKSGDILGTLLPSIAKATGLPPATPVAVGMHDSNASLYPHILERDAPFSVISTGTWVIVMALGGRPIGLDPDRDTLMNVSALGDPVPSARFMGGREYERVQQAHPCAPTPNDIAQVLAEKRMLLPAVEAQTGPFQGRQMRWIGTEPAVGSGLRAAALSFYLAMMTDTCLDLTGADGPSIVEGPFAGNPEFLRMLAAATGRPVFASDAATGTAIGAALLFADKPPSGRMLPATKLDNPSQWRAYAALWRKFCQSGPVAV
ncbi:L-fuculokinase [Roseobacter fucihabitans]|uniref:L-fuculokinase n=1 Tax=Roseobacter fucihabitans TaxID=1537242 RepID=A0ABZ2BUQ9_9RHOB|nr:FGGY-family carbohydrate kinase [Roseobacter litoralis]MBC6966136.1 L-fuculokinase [Roseobacter litoralis]